MPQSIETAPRDGSQFIGYVEGEPHQIYWDDGYSIHGLGGRWMTMDHWSYFGIEVTHWSPIEQFP